MRTLAWLLVAAAASSLTACAPKTCDPQPMPAEHQNVAPFLPSSAVVCGLTDDKKRLLLNFPERDVTKLTQEVLVKLAADNWSLGKSDAKIGNILASKGGRYFHMNIDDHKGGPNVGRVTGSVMMNGSN